MAEGQPSNPSPSPSPSEETSARSQVPNASGSQISPDAPPQMFPMMYPPLMPGFGPPLVPESNDHGPGLYAVQSHPFMGPMAGLPSSMLIPLSYKIPTRTNSGGPVGEGQGQDARQQNGPQRQVVVRRFQIGFQIDLALIIKLAAIVFLFSQEGSKQRLILLLCFAALVYLYQTGVFHPFIQRMRRGAVPQPRPAIQRENALRAGHGDRNDLRDEQNFGVENQHQPAGPQEPQAANGNQQEPDRGNGLNWLGIVKEIQTIAVGFIMSLLPGFHHND